MKVMLNSNNYNRNTNLHKQQAFGGIYNSLTDKLAQGFANLTKKECTIKAIDRMAKYNVTSLIAKGTGITISSFYILNVANSKKIEQDQKKPLMINMALVTTISTVLGHYIDKALHSKVDKFTEYFVAKNTGKMNPELLKTCKKGIGPASTLLVFATIYRYFAPVIATPIANKISNALTDKEKANKQTLDKKA